MYHFAHFQGTQGRLRLAVGGRAPGPSLTALLCRGWDTSDVFNGPVGHEDVECRLGNRCEKVTIVKAGTTSQFGRPCATWLHEKKSPILGQWAKSCCRFTAFVEVILPEDEEVPNGWTMHSAVVLLLHGEVSPLYGWPKDSWNASAVLVYNVYRIIYVHIVWWCLM